MKGKGLEALNPYLRPVQDAGLKVLKLGKVNRFMMLQ
jgi:phosphate starvation-inducible protein PhoH